MYSGPPVRLTIHAMDQQRQISMPIGTSVDEGAMREHLKEICSKMPHMHVALYDGAVLIDERRPNASFH